MRLGPQRLATLPLAVALCGLTAGAAFAQASTERVSFNTLGGDPNSAVRDPVLSDDARYIAFSSLATNLVAGDSNGHSDVFLRDRATGLTTLVSVNDAGVQADDLSNHPAISGDGRFVAFMSKADNLVAGHANTFGDIYLRDLAAGTTTLVTGATGGVIIDMSEDMVHLSHDGGRLVWASPPTLGASGAPVEIWVLDRASGTTSLVSDVYPGSPTSPANAYSTYAQISADGNVVAFVSQASNLVPGDTNGKLDVFARDLTTQTTVLVSLDSAGVQANANSHRPSLSADGRFIAFESVASNLVPGDTNGLNDVFVRDLELGTTVRVSTSSKALGGLEGDGFSAYADLASNGRHVAFWSTATTLVALDTNGAGDVFRHDLLTGTTVRVSVDSLGVQANSYSENPQVTGDGRHVVFHSKAWNFVPGDMNGLRDVYLHDLGAPAPEAYCTAKVNSLGCTPAVSHTGSASLAAGDLEVRADGVLSQKHGLMFWGTTATALPFQGGTRCVAAPLVRTPIQSSGGSPAPVDCTGSYGFLWTAAYTSTKGLTAGDTVYNQFWSRDASSPGGTGLSDALVVTFQP